MNNLRTIVQVKRQSVAYYTGLSIAGTGQVIGGGWPRARMWPSLLLHGRWAQNISKSADKVTSAYPEFYEGGRSESDIPVPIYVVFSFPNTQQIDKHHPSVPLDYGYLLHSAGRLPASPLTLMAGQTATNEVDANVSHLHYGRPGGSSGGPQSSRTMQMGSEQTRGIPWAFG